MREVDYLIVGQGLAGSLLSYNLLKAGKDILVIDSVKEVTSSKIAAGLYNPITGRRMVKTWLADTLFPYLETFYAELETFLQTKFLYKKPIFRPFESLADQNYWYGQSSDDAFKNYINLSIDISNIETHFHAPFGGFETNTSGYIKVSVLLQSFNECLILQNRFIAETFSHPELKFSEAGIEYKNIKAKSIVFCEGHSAKNNPLCQFLPIEGTKGQILDVEIENYSLDTIVNKRVFILPENNYQRVGSTYDRDFTDDQPTIAASDEITVKLNAILKSKYIITREKSAIRPTVVDRKPILGKHPKADNVFVFNGLGTKGVSLAPYFAAEMANYLIHDKPLMKEVDIQRFAYLYH